MKLYQRLALNALVPSLFLAGLGFTFYRINSNVKSHTERILSNSWPEVRDSKEMTESLQIIQAATQEYLLEIEEKKINSQEDGAEESGGQELEANRALEIIRQGVSDFERELNDAKETNFRAIQSSSNVAHNGSELEEVREIKWLDSIEKEFYLYKEHLERYFAISRENPGQAYDFLENTLEPQLRNIIYPLTIEYQKDAMGEMEEDTQKVLENVELGNKYITLFAGISFVSSLGMMAAISRSVYKPIRRLEQSMSQGKHGQLEAIQIVDLQGKNELSALARKYNQMVEGLKQTTVSKSYLDKILISLLDSLIVVSLDGNIRKINRATSQLLEYREDELIDKNIGSIWADEALTIEKLIAKKELENYETTYITKGGKKIPVAFSSSLLVNEENVPEAIVCLARDITEKYLAQKALKESEERYALAALAANDGLWDWNLLSNQIYFSLRWKSLLGYEEEAIKNIPDEWFKRVHPDDRNRVSQAIIAYLQNPVTPLEMCYQMLHKDNSYRWMLCRGIGVKDEQGKIYRLTGSQTDITQSRLSEEKLRYQAMYDGLTGLPNRTYFLDKLNNLFELCRKGEGKPFAILFIDIDDFKKVNDSLGHLIGDELLVAFTRRLKEHQSSENVLARLGGDEFAIIVENIKDPNEATKLADKIARQFDKPLQLKEREIFVRASIGIAPLNENYDRVEELLRDADTAMYRAKAAGKARYMVFESQMYLEAVNALELENDLHRAIEREEFQVFYQPIVKLATRQIVGFEALVRWQHPEKGLISPAKFIPLAEENGSIVPLGYWIMEQACRQMRQWQEKYQVARNMTVSINLSPVQLRQSEQKNSFNCVEKIRTILEKTGLEPHSLKLEITESTIMESLDRTNTIIEQIKDLGIKLSMDDFGTGYSSLNYLHHLSLDTLKIDRSFIKELSTNKDKLEMTKIIINLARALRMEVVAEGIETNEQQTILAELNCEYGQGYLFSKPVCSTDSEILIATMEQLTKYVSASKCCVLQA